MNEIVHKIAWDRFCSKDYDYENDKYGERLFINYANILDTRNINVKLQGPSYVQLPDKCIDILSEQLAQLIDTAGNISKIGVLVKLFCILGRCVENFVILKQTTIVETMEKCVSFVLAQDDWSGNYEIFEYALYFLEMIFDWRFLWRVLKTQYYNPMVDSHWSTATSNQHNSADASVPNSHLHQRQQTDQFPVVNNTTVAWIHKVLTDHSSDFDVRNRMLHLLGAIIKGSSHNSKVITTPAIFDLINLSGQVTSDALITYCCLVENLAGITPHERQEDLNHVVKKLLSYMIKKCDSFSQQDLRCLCMLVGVTSELSGEIVESGLLSLVQLCLQRSCNDDNSKDMTQLVFRLLGRVTSHNSNTNAHNQFVDCHGYDKILSFLLSGSSWQSDFLLDMVFSWAVNRQFDAAQLHKVDYVIEDGNVVALLIKWASHLARIYDVNNNRISNISCPNGSSNQLPDESSNQQADKELSNQRSSVNWRAILKLIGELIINNRVNLHRCADEATSVVNAICESMHDACTQWNITAERQTTSVECCTSISQSHEEDCVSVSQLQLMQSLLQLMALLLEFSVDGVTLDRILSMCRDTSVSQVLGRPLIQMLNEVINRQSNQDNFICHWYEFYRADDCLQFISPASIKHVVSPVRRPSSSDDTSPPIDLGSVAMNSSLGFSFVCWINIEPRQDSNRALLYRVMSNLGNGFEAFVSKNGDLVVATCCQGEYYSCQIPSSQWYNNRHTTTDFPSLSDRSQWQMLSVVYQYAKNFLSRSSVTVYKDCHLICSHDLKYPTITSSETIQELVAFGYRDNNSSCCTAPSPSNSPVSTPVGGKDQRSVSLTTRTHNKLSTLFMSYNTNSTSSSITSGGSAVTTNKIRRGTAEELSLWGQPGVLRSQMVAMRCYGEAVTRAVITQIFSCGPIRSRLTCDDSLQQPIIFYHAARFVSSPTNHTEAVITNHSLCSAYRSPCDSSCCGLCVNLAHPLNDGSARVYGHRLTRRRLENAFGSIGGPMALLPLLIRLRDMTHSKRYALLSPSSSAINVNCYGVGHLGNGLGLDGGSRAIVSIDYSGGDKFHLVTDARLDNQITESLLGSVLILIRKLLGCFGDGCRHLVRSDFVPRLAREINTNCLELLDANVVLALHSLVEESNSTNQSEARSTLINQLYRLLLLDWSIWSAVEIAHPIREQHAAFILNVVKHDRQYFRNNFGVQWFLDAIILYNFPVVEDEAENLTRRNIRQTIFSMVFFMLSYNVSVDKSDYQNLIRFIHYVTSHDDLVLEGLDLLSELFHHPSCRIQEVFLEPQCVETLYHLLVKSSVGSRPKAALIKLLVEVVQLGNNSSGGMGDKRRPAILLGECSFAGIYTSRNFYRCELTPDSIQGLLAIQAKTGPSDIFGLVQMLALLILAPIQYRIQAILLLQRLLNRYGETELTAQPGWQDILVHLLANRRKSETPATDQLEMHADCKDLPPTNIQLRKTSTWALDDSLNESSPNCSGGTKHHRHCEGTILEEDDSLCNDVELDKAMRHMISCDDADLVQMDCSDKDGAIDGQCICLSDRPQGDSSSSDVPLLSYTQSGRAIAADNQSLLSMDTDTVSIGPRVAMATSDMSMTHTQSGRAIATDNQSLLSLDTDTVSIGPRVAMATTTYALVSSINTETSVTMPTDDDNISSSSNANPLDRCQIEHSCDLDNEQLTELVIECLATTLWSQIRSSTTTEPWIEVHVVMESLNSVSDRYLLLTPMIVARQQILIRLIQLMSQHLASCLEITNNQTGMDLSSSSGRNQAKQHQMAMLLTMMLHARELVNLIVDSSQSYLAQIKANQNTTNYFDIELVENLMILLQDRLEVWDRPSCTSASSLACLGQYLLLVGLSAAYSQSDSPLIAALCAKLHQIICLQTASVTNPPAYEELSLIIIQIDRILRQPDIPESSFHFIGPVLKTLLERYWTFLQLDIFMPDLCIRDSTLLDDPLTYASNEEWLHFLTTRLVPANEMCQNTLLDGAMVTEQSLWRAQANERLSVDRRARSKQCSQHRHKFQNAIGSWVVRWNRDEHRRLDKLQTKKQSTSSSTPPRDLMDGEPVVYWSISSRENKARQRPLFERNLYPVRPANTSANQSQVAWEQQHDDPMRSLGQVSAAAVAVASTNEEEDDALNEDDWVSLLDSPSPGEMKTPLTSPLKLVANKSLIELDCHLVTILNITPGTFSLNQSEWRFVSSGSADTSTNSNHPTQLFAPINQLREVHLRRYNLRRSAIEIFLTDQSNYFFNFDTKTRNKVYSKILSCRPPNLIYSKQRSPADVLKNSGLTQKWVNRDISNFEYLMHLNTIAGRTYNDLSQYPVFPWIIADYASDKLDLTKPATFRNLAKPIGVANPANEREVQEKYENFEDPHGVIQKFHYGTHYSSAAGVMHYLVRMEPYSTLHVQLQGGKFDVADRQFHSIPLSWNFIMESAFDNKELIPEFFYQSEFLKNNNGFDLGRLQQSSQESIDNVELPKWASTAEQFIELHREALECDYVSSNLHQWIDLIFGYKQKGPEAVKALNVFYYVTYEGCVDLDRITDPDERQSIESMINNFGQTPCQLLKTPHPRRMTLSDMKEHCMRIDRPLCLLSQMTSSAGVGTPDTREFGASQLHHSCKVIDARSGPIIKLQMLQCTGNASWKHLSGTGTSTQAGTIPLITVHHNGYTQLVARHLWSPCTKQSLMSQSTFTLDLDSVFESPSLRRKMQLASTADWISPSNQLYCLSPDGRFLVAGGDPHGNLVVILLANSSGGSLPSMRAYLQSQSSIASSSAGVAGASGLSMATAVAGSSLAGNNNNQSSSSSSSSILAFSTPHSAAISIVAMDSDGSVGGMSLVTTAAATMASTWGAHDFISMQDGTPQLATPTGSGNPVALATASRRDPSVVVWTVWQDAAHIAQVISLSPQDGGVSALALSTFLDLLAVAPCTRSDIRLYQVTSGRLLHRLVLPQSTPSDVSHLLLSTSTSQLYVAVGGNGTEAQLLRYSLAPGTPPQACARLDSHRVSAMQAVSDYCGGNGSGLVLLVGNIHGNLYFLDGDSLVACARPMLFQHGVSDVAMTTHAHGNQLLVALADMGSLILTTASGS